LAELPTPGVSSPEPDKNNASPNPLRTPPKEKDSDDGMRESPSALTLFLVMLVLVVSGYFLIMKVIEISRNEDCLMSGRRNCAQTDTGSQ
jgi:hypothetical protein